MPRLLVAMGWPAGGIPRPPAMLAGVGGARWLPLRQFHLTLRFIGEVDNRAFADIADGISDVACAPFSLRLRGVGHFPTRGPPRVLWAGVDAVGELMRLQGQIESRLRRLGQDPEGRNFAPHVTLARLKGVRLDRLGDYLAFHGDFVTPAIPVTEFHLYSSTLGAKAAIHSVEASYPLGVGLETS